MYIHLYVYTYIYIYIYTHRYEHILCSGIREGRSPSSEPSDLVLGDWKSRRGGRGGSSRCQAIGAGWPGEHLYARFTPTGWALRLVVCSFCTPVSRQRVGKGSLCGTSSGENTLRRSLRGSAAPRCGFRATQVGVFDDRAYVLIFDISSLVAYIYLSLSLSLLSLSLSLSIYIYIHTSSNALSSNALTCVLQMDEV